MRGCGALLRSECSVGPVNALGKCILCRRVWTGKVVHKAHHTVGAGAAASAGNGDLGCIAPLGAGAGAGGNAVFADGNGGRADGRKGYVQN